jgi:alkylation response protein AidB-like acyl-CoA dehydrogenase
METKVAPIITKYWVEDSFPFELLPAIKELNIGGVAMQGYGCRGGSAQLFGLIAMEMARTDSSFATFWGVHNGLAMGSIYLGGSEEQKQKWLPPMARWEKIVGCCNTDLPDSSDSCHDEDSLSRGTASGSPVWAVSSWQ